MLNPLESEKRFPPKADNDYTERSKKCVAYTKGLSASDGMLTHTHAVCPLPSRNMYLVLIN